jgi:hypothetical protein
VRTEDDSFVNISRINGSRVRMWHFVLQSGRGEIFRSLSTIIRSINTTTFALIDRNPLITNQVHSGRKVQLDSKTRGRADRYSLLVRNFHPLLHAGLSRRTVIEILHQSSNAATVCGQFSLRDHQFVGCRPLLLRRRKRR